MVQWLSASADASAGAGHDLYGMEFRPAGPDVFEQLAGIAQSVGYADVKREAVKVYGCLPDTIPCLSVH